MQRLAKPWAPKQGHIGSIPIPSAIVRKVALVGGQTVSKTVAGTSVGPRVRLLHLPPNSPMLHRTTIDSVVVICNFYRVGI